MLTNQGSTAQQEAPPDATRQTLFLPNNGKNPKPTWWMKLLGLLLALPRGLTNGIPTACAMLVFGTRVGIPFPVSIFLAAFFGVWGFYGPLARIEFTISEGINRAHQHHKNKKSFSLWHYILFLAGFKPWPTHEIAGELFDEEKPLALNQLSILTRLRILAGIAWALLMPFMDSFIAFVSVFLLFFTIAAITGSTFGLPIIIPIAVGTVLAAFTLFCQWHELPRAILEDFGIARFFTKNKPLPAPDDTAHITATALKKDARPPSFWANVGSHAIALIVATLRGIGNALPTACAMLSFASFFGNAFGPLGISLAVIFGVCALYVPFLRVRSKMQTALFKAFSSPHQFVAQIIEATALVLADRVFPEKTLGRLYFARFIAFLIPFIEGSINFVSIFLLFGTLAALSGGTLAVPLAIPLAVGAALGVATFISSWFDMTPKVMSHFGFGHDDGEEFLSHEAKQQMVDRNHITKAAEILGDKIRNRATAAPDDEATAAPSTAPVADEVISATPVTHGVTPSSAAPVVNAVRLPHPAPTLIFSPRPLPAAASPAMLPLASLWAADDSRQPTASPPPASLHTGSSETTPRLKGVNFKGVN